MIVRKTCNLPTNCGHCVTVPEKFTSRKREPFLNSLQKRLLSVLLCAFPVISPKRKNTYYTQNATRAYVSCENKTNKLEMIMMINISGIYAHICCVV